MTLSSEVIGICKATAPVLQEHGLAITQKFYANLFQNHPYVNNLFNKSHVFPQNGQVSAQASALANAVLGYATYMDDLSQLTEAVKIIANKHVSLNIQPEHYQDVGTELLKSIKEILGDAATDEIINAWKDAYFYLADILIGIEETMRKELKEKGGWIGFEPFIVESKIPETEDTTTFHFKRANGNPIPPFKAGQYLSLKFPQGTIADIDFDTLRNYSLSCGENSRYFQITVKKEASSDVPPGLISNFLHGEVKEGDEILIGMPCGTFNLEDHDQKNLVFISGGIGVTPNMSFLQSLRLETDRKIYFLQCVKNAENHVFAQKVDQLASKNSNLISHAFYSQSQEKLKLSHTEIHSGRITGKGLKKIIEKTDLEDCHFYVCGPPGFTKCVLKTLEDEMNVPKGQIRFEYFGPQLQ